MLSDESRSTQAAAECTCEAKEVMLLPCSGGSNCGQIANQAAVKLTQEGVGNIYCLAGIAAHIDGMVESARSAKRIVALDGCSVACARKAVEHVGLLVTDWVCVTDAGIEKNHEFDIPGEHVDTVVKLALASLAGPPKAQRRKVA